MLSPVLVFIDIAGTAEHRFRYIRSRVVEHGTRSGYLAATMDFQVETELAQGPLPAYRAKLASGELATDPAQALVAERLQGLWTKLRGYDPEPRRPAAGFLTR